MFGNSNNQWPIQEAKKDIAANEGLFIDVREEFEVTEGHAEGTIWIPLNDIMSNPEKVAQKLKNEHGDKKYYIYCRSGNRSGMASQILMGQGLKCANAGGLVDLSNNDVTIVSGLPK